MEDIYHKIVEHIFTNWTALKLAIEHGMAGPNSQQVASECIKYMVQYCLSDSSIQVEDIEEAIEDIMDQEFDTVCEDNSPKEIAVLLHKFLILLKDGNIEQCELEYRNLPTNQHQPQKLPVATTQVVQQENDNAVNTEPNHSEVEMIDSDWTEVKSRRRR